MKRRRIEITAIHRRTTLIINRSSCGLPIPENSQTGQSFKAETIWVDEIQPPNEIRDAGIADELRTKAIERRRKS